MREFFHGWKPKVGVVTLVMACVFMAGWMRSLSVMEGFPTSKDHDTACFVESAQARMTWARRRMRNGQLLQAPDSYYGFPVPSTAAHPEPDECRWKWALLGFNFSLIYYGDVEIHQWTVPYWSIVLMLTTISALLLLSKTRTPDTGHSDGKNNAKSDSASITILLKELPPHQNLWVKFGSGSLPS